MPNTPDTDIYLLLGMIITTGLPLLFIASVYLRWKNFHRDLKMIETLQDK